MSQDPAGRGTAARRRRADAERSIDAILDATLDCVLAGGEVNLAAIARAAGLSRVTLYAHFPTREALLDAAVDRALTQLAELLRETPLDEGRAPEVLARLLRTSWQQLDRYRNLHAVASPALPPARLRALHEPSFGRIEELLARGQADGDFRTDLPRDWLLATIYTLMHLAAEEVSGGRLAAARAGDVITSTVLSVLTADSSVVAGPA